MFNHKHFATIIYLGIIITLLALTFNLIDILQKSSKATGYVISEKPINNIFKDIDIKAFLEDRIISNPSMPYYFYNSIILILFLVISGILIRYIYKAQTGII